MSVAGVWTVAAATVLLVAADAGTPSSARTALRLCPAEAAAPGPYASPEGSGVTLRAEPAAEHPGGCATAILPLLPGEVVATWLASPRVMARLSRGAALVAPPGSPAGGYWEPLEDAVSAPAPAPLFVDLLDALLPTGFGAEGRAAWRRLPGGVLEVACRAGGRPAGVTLAVAGWALPPGDGLRLALERQGGGVHVGLSDEARRRAEQPLMLGVVPDGQGAVVFPVPDRALSAADPLGLTLSCPDGPATLRLSGLRFELHVEERPVARATWAWEPASWAAGGRGLLARLGAERLDRVFVSVPVEAGRVADAAALGRFVAAARARGVAVWAVEGDPRAVLASERPGFVARTRALAAYNRTAGPQGRLAGVQYDIEPYLLPGYALNPAGWLGALGDLVAELAGAAGGAPIDVAIPFWMPREPGGEALMARLAAAVRSVTVMAYRTDPREIQAAAAAVLAWGDNVGREVLVALELGPLAAETRTDFRPAPRGRLWTVQVGGRPALVLLKEARANPFGAALEPRRSAAVGLSRTSFLGDRRRVREILPGLTRAWLWHRSFAGTALHGLLDLAAPSR